MDAFERAKRRRQKELETVALKRSDTITNRERSGTKVNFNIVNFNIVNFNIVNFNLVNFDIVNFSCSQF